VGIENSEWFLVGCVGIRREIVDRRSGASRLPLRREEMKAMSAVIRREASDGILRYVLIGV
jgi:hypothetical protein